MDAPTAHQEHAKKLLYDAGASLTTPPEQLDPQLANAQAATTLLAKKNAPPMAPLPPVEELTADLQNRNPEAERQGFIAQANKSAETQAMAQQQLADQKARDAGPPIAGAFTPTPGAVSNGPQDLITGPADLETFAAKLRDKSLANTYSDAAAAKKIAVETGAVDRAQALSEKPFVDDLAKKSEESMVRLQNFQAQVEEQQQKKMAHFQTVQDEMSKMAMEQPKDLMGQAGVNSILGHIAIFLGGAGVNGFHENKNLQMIQSMADRNVQAQKTRYEMLQRVGQGDQTIYGMLTQKLQSKTAVEAALRTGYLDTYSAHLKAVGNQYADKRSKLRTDTLLAGIDEQKHKTLQGVEQSFMQTSTQAVQLYDTQLIAQMKAQAEAQAAELARFKVAKEVEKEQYERTEKVKETSFLGIKGTSGKEAHAKMTEVWGGAYNMVQNLDEAQRIMKADANFGNARAYEALKNINLGEAKKYFNTGARLEPKEVSMMEAVGISYPQYAEALMLNGGVGLTGSQIAEGMKGIQWLIAHNAFTSLKAGAPHLEVDSSDPVMGRFFGTNEMAQPKWRAEAEKRHGNEKGSQMLAAMPDYKETYPNSMGY